MTSRRSGISRAQARNQLHSPYTGNFPSLSSLISAFFVFPALLAHGRQIDIYVLSTNFLSCVILNNTHLTQLNSLSSVGKNKAYIIQLRCLDAKDQ